MRCSLRCTGAISRTLRKAVRRRGRARVWRRLPRGMLELTVMHRVPVVAAKNTSSVAERGAADSQPRPQAAATGSTTEARHPTTRIRIGTLAAANRRWLRGEDPTFLGG